MTQANKLKTKIILAALQETVPCKLCGTATPMTATKLCDGCWELERRVLSDPERARQILDDDWNVNLDEMPGDGTPYLVCLERKTLGSHVHVAITNLNSAKKPMTLIGNNFAFDMPPIIGWKHAPKPMIKEPGT